MEPLPGALRASPAPGGAEHALGALSSRSKCPAGRAPHLAEAGGGGTGGFLSHLQPRVVLQEPGAGGAGAVVPRREEAVPSAPSAARGAARARRLCPRGSAASHPAAPKPPQPAIAVVPPRGKCQLHCSAGGGGAGARSSALRMM